MGYAGANLSRRFTPTARWHLDEMVVKIRGRRMLLWRAVDDEGKVLDVLVQKRRNKAAALKLLRKLLKNQGNHPETVVTDGLASYPALYAQRHHQHRLFRPADGLGKRGGRDRLDGPRLTTPQDLAKLRRERSRHGARRFLANSGLEGNTPPSIWPLGPLASVVPLPQFPNAATDQS